MSDLYTQVGVPGSGRVEGGQAAATPYTPDPFRDLEQAERQLRLQRDQATDEEEKKRLSLEAAKIRGYLTSPTRGTSVAPEYQQYLPQKEVKPVYDEKNPTFDSTLGLMQASNPQQKALIDRLKVEKNAIERQKLLDQLAGTAGGVQAAQIGALQRLNESYKQPESVPQVMKQVEEGQQRVARSTYVPDAAPPKMQEAAMAPQQSQRASYQGQGQYAAQTGQSVPKEMRQKLDATMSQLQKTKDPAAWWQILGAIADVAAAGLKGAAGQSHVTQAQRDMMAQQEMESARQLTAEQFQNAMANQEYEAEIQQQREAEQFERQKELSRMGYGFDAQQQAAQREFQRELATQKNLPPIAPAF